MGEELSSDIIKATQVSLGKYVKRPPLTDKLLKKPPFRFLHDIILSVLKSTEFFSGLFEDDELISDNVKDRESKTLFLNKVIYVVGTTTGKSLSIKSSKIIAGQEPEKTNELLQCLAFALDNNLSSDDAVKLFKESVKFNASNDKKHKDITKFAKKSTDTRKNNSKGSDKSLKNDKGAPNVTKLNKKENTIVKKESPPKKSLPSKVVTKKVPEKPKATNRNYIAIANSDNINEETSQKCKTEEPVIDKLELATDQNLSLSSLNINGDKDVTAEVNSESNISNNKEYSVSQETFNDEHGYVVPYGIDKNITEDNKHIENRIAANIDQEESKYEYKEQNTNLNNDNQEPMIPQTNEVENFQEANEKNDNDYNTETCKKKFTDSVSVKRPPSVRPSSSRPGAPRLRDKHETIPNVEHIVSGKVNIIAEKTANEEEDESTIVIVDNNLINLQDEKDQMQVAPDQHGHLVQQILDAQKEFTKAAGKTEIEWQFGAQKTRDVANQEIEQLRFNIQALSRIANPLGKLLDHIQEDVEVMRQELQQWISAYENTSKELLKQKIANDEYLLPLYARIKQLNLDIAEKHDKINDLKIVVHKNSSRIDKLLTSGNVL